MCRNYSRKSPGCFAAVSERKGGLLHLFLKKRKKKEKKKKTNSRYLTQGWTPESILILRPQRTSILLLRLRDPKIKSKIATEASTVPVLEELVVLWKSHVHECLPPGARNSRATADPGAPQGRGARRLLTPCGGGAGLPLGFAVGLGRAVTFNWL